MNKSLQNRLLILAAALGIFAGSTAIIRDKEVPKSVVLAMELAKEFESSGKHIGIPYIDTAGKGQPLTVCNGITGPKVKAGRYYTEEECFDLELEHYTKDYKILSRKFKYWEEYNMWVQASIIDMTYNLGVDQVLRSTMYRKANAGDLTGACMEMLRWVYGTVNGKSTKLRGLVKRRDASKELCAEWGREGHFSDLK